MDNEKTISEVAKEIAKPAYDDLVHPVAEPTGKTAGLIPRAIKAALLPVEKWVLAKEYNLEATRKLLEEKLANTPEELIDTPEPYVAVPALQRISYCMDNETLRDMYANLLATSMKKDTKNNAHPAFADIISQLSPDEAKIMSYFKVIPVIPTITLRFEKDDMSGINIYNNFSVLGEIVDCEYPYDINKYFDNLSRLGLVKISNQSYITNEDLYAPIINHKHIKELEKTIVTHKDLSRTKTNKGYVQVTDYGKSFCECCISLPITLKDISLYNLVKIG